MTNAGNRILTHSAIYFSGNLLRRAASFFMLPIYTHYLTPADYGFVELLSMILDFVGIIIGMRIGQALFRFYGEYDEIKEKNEVITTGLFLVASLNLFGILLVWAFSDSISSLVFGNTQASSLLKLFSFTLLGTAFVEIPMLYLRALQKPWQFVFVSLSKLVVQLGLNIYFLVFRQMGVEGVIYSAVLSTILVAILLLIYTFKRVGFMVSIEKAKNLTSFSVPMVITSIIAFYVTFGDRYFLKYYRNIAEVGVYSLGYKFGFLLVFIVASPFFSIWDSEKYNIMKRNDAETVYKNVFLIYSITVVFCVVGISIMVKDILRLMSDPSYWRAHEVVPVILIAYALDALTNFTNLGILVHKRTGLIAYGQVISGIVITAGYFLLIPRMGGMGAALATLCAFIARFVYVTRESQKLFRIDFPWKQVSIFSGIGSFAFLLSQFGPDHLWSSIVFNLSLSVIFLASLLIFPILPVEWRSALIQNMIHPKMMLNNLASMRK